MIVKYITKFYTHNLGSQSIFGCVYVHFIYGFEFNRRGGS